MSEKKVAILEAPNLRELESVRHGFFTRTGGVSTGIYDSLNVGFGSDDSAENVRENRRRAMAALDRPPEALHTVHQEHGAQVVRVSQTYWNPMDAPRADAMVTDRPGKVLGVMAADCVPVLFADASAGVVGAAHSGWRGTIVGVLAATVEAMEKLGADRKGIHAAVGPAIAQESYEVGPEFPVPFLERDAEYRRFFVPSPREGHHMFDLTGCVMDQLAGLGLASVAHLDLDTCADPERFFSYRRATHRGEPDYGRGLSAITLGD